MIFSALKLDDREEDRFRFEPREEDETIQIVSPIFVPEMDEEPQDQEDDHEHDSSEVEHDDATGQQSWEELKGTKTKLLSELLRRNSGDAGTGAKQGKKKELWELLGRRKK